jgi:hypothetical protein
MTAKAFHIHSKSIAFATDHCSLSLDGTKAIHKSMPKFATLVSEA